MSSITDTPPQNVQSDLNTLIGSLDQTIPKKNPNHNLLIATWNIRSFGSLTRKWTADQNDSPKRDLRGLRSIAEIIKRFDVVAIQELVGDLRALRDLMKFLGNQWSFLMTDITLGDAGNNERLGFLFDNQRTQPSGLACELVIPPDLLVGKDSTQKQFARTPYAVSFRAGETTFILATLHVEYGDESDDRIPELRGIAQWMANWARRSTKWHHNLLTLGDFNIDRWGSPLWQAFTSTGLTVPNELNNCPKTIFANPQNPQNDKFYDQIAWFTSGNSIRLNMRYNTGGFFNFLPHVYTDLNLSKRSVSYRISDHYPLWTEFLL